MIRSKPIIENEFKILLNEWKNFKIQSVLALQCKKRNDRKIFHASFKLIGSDSGVYAPFKFMYQNIISKIKNSDRKDWVVTETIVKQSIKTLLI